MAGSDQSSSSSANEAKTQGKEYRDPTCYEADICAFEAQDRANPPPEGAIVCVGDSNILAWHRTIGQDLAPLTLVPRGFGGSQMNEALFYADRIVASYKPRAVLLCEGENDLNWAVSPARILAAFREFVKRVHAKLPEARIYVLSLKPSPERMALWPQMQEVNRLLMDACAGNPLLTYIDVGTPMFDAAGRVREDAFSDGLHLNRTGYEIWRDVVRPMLLEGEGKFEKPG